MKPDIFALVNEGVTISRRMKTDGDRLKEIRALLAKQGAGTFQGADGKASVSLPGPTLKPKSDDIEKVKDLVDKTTFAKLFDSAVVYSPVKAFREVAAALLTPAKAKKVIAICEQESAAQVKFA